MRKTSTYILAQTAVPDKGIITTLVETSLENAPGALAGLILGIAIVAYILQRLGVVEYFKSIKTQAEENGEKIDDLSKKLEVMKENTDKLNDKLLERLLNNDNRRR